MKEIIKSLVLTCGIIISLISCIGQTSNTEFIYDRNGNKIIFNELDTVVHVGFVSDVSIDTIKEILDNLSSIADYTMLPDSSYRFVVKQGACSIFKENALKYNIVAYCQNEYMDSLNGFVWGANRILLKMKEEHPIETMLESLNLSNLQYESKWYDSTIYALIIPKNSNIFTTSNRIFESGDVVYAQPSFFHTAIIDGYETNPKFDEQWNLRDTALEHGYDTTICLLGINAIRAWKFTTGSPSIKIAIMDDGVKGTHEDLTDNFLFEKNYTGIVIDNMIKPREHGTKCAGIISAANNDKGLVGIAHNCGFGSFIAYCDYRNLTRDNEPPGQNGVIHQFSDELFEEAIHYACDSVHISVFSCSWHLEGFLSETFISAINYATQYGRNGKGCVFVFSSGNRRDSTDTDQVKPTAILPNVLAVGATMQTGYRISTAVPEEGYIYNWESCCGDSLDLMAPGEMSWTTCYNSNSCYDYFEGTSASAPHVAGVAALVLSMDTNLTYQQVFEILCSSATKVRSDYYSYSHNPSYPYGTWNNETGYGLVNAHHAILKTLYRDYYVTGTSEIELCETGSYHIHGTTPFNDTITNCWTSSPNIEILSTSDSVIARGIYPGTGWIAFNIIHDNDSLPIYFPITVSNGQISVITNHEITSNTTLSTPYFTNSDLIIDSLATLTITDTLYIASGSRIIVRPGGALVVSGGTITSACDGEMWQGIIVEGNADQRQQASKQGSVVLTNATIQNARTAISTKGADNNAVYEHTGGMIQATNTLFRNNMRTAEFLEYENHKTNGDVTNNASYFTRCTFTVDDDNLFAENDAVFKNHVSLWKVRGVKFNGCTFRNETTGAGIADTARGKAIYTQEAGFLARRVCPVVSNIDPCACEGTPTDTVTRCSFSGFYKAIHAANDNAAYEILIDNCDFSQNKTGVELDAANNARVSFCNFDLNHTQTSLYGVSLKNSTGYTVESNNFYRSHYTPIYALGVHCDNSGIAENKIHLNDFTKLYYGCYAKNCNGTQGTKVRGLQYTCNDFDSCKYSIYVSSSAKVRTAQGSLSSGADNTFSNDISIGRSITIPSDHDSVTYYYSTGNHHLPYGGSRFRLRTASANDCSSTLCGGLTPLDPEPRGTATLAQYRLMAEELSSLVAEYAGRGYSEDDATDNAEAAALMEQMSDLSAAMGDLSHAAIRTILSDSVVDVALLKEWYRAIVGTWCTASPQQPGQTTPVPVAAYQLSEVYSTERDWTAAREVLASIPVWFVMDSVDADEYRNYLALQQLRENVEGNWYRQSQPEIAELQGVAEHNAGRAARMAKEILCFFHHICYEDEPLLELEGIGERNTRSGVVHRAATTENGTLTLYPNPAHNTLTVESASPIREITIYDMTGHAVMVETGRAPSLQQVVNTSSLHAGIYLLKVITDNDTETAKFVKD